jgi:hypothetical protein
VDDELKAELRAAAAELNDLAQELGERDAITAEEAKIISRAVAAMGHVVGDGTLATDASSLESDPPD